MLMKLGTYSRNLTGFAAVGLLSCLLVSADAQEIRNYNANFTTNTIVADGVISPGEWDGADPVAGDWRELRMPFSDVDTDNNRFQILWDASNLYILYQTDYDIAGGWLSNLGGTQPGIVFGEENLNLYIDPNRDGDLNTDSDGNPLDPGVSNGSNTDGYQLAFNQYEGTTISTESDYQGVGFFTEAHVNSPFGDAGGWNEGGDASLGAALAGSGIVVAQTNTNSGGNGAGGLAEIVIPFADLDAVESFEADPEGAPGELTFTGLNATDDGARTGPEDGEVWGFNMSMITRENPGNFLPIWNHHDNNSFAPWPHGTLTFVDNSGPMLDRNEDGDIDGDDFLAIQRDDPSLIADWETAYPQAAPSAASSVPEPATSLMALSAALMSLARRRR